jgi:hypothetical protein
MTGFSSALGFQAESREIPRSMVADIFGANAFIRIGSTARGAPLTGVATEQMTGVMLNVRMLRGGLSRSRSNNHDRRQQRTCERQCNGVHKSRSSHDISPSNIGSTIIAFAIPLWQFARWAECGRKLAPRAVMRSACNGPLRPPATADRTPSKPVETQPGFQWAKPFE